MTLLQWDDFVGTEDFKDAVWVERKVRFLVPRNDLSKPNRGFDENAWTVDTLTSTQVGFPVACGCGKVAIRYGTMGEPPFYPWGEAHYGKRDSQHRVPGQYCPHCDGGEDMG